MSKILLPHFAVHKMQMHRHAALFCCVTLLGVALGGGLPGGVASRGVYAQDSANTSADTPVQAVREVSDDEVKAVAQDLWCPLCSGVRLDTCELKACEQMRQEIAIQLAKGESPENIKNYFLAQYGPQVLGEPPREGFNLLAWIVPFVVLVGAAGVLLYRSRRLLAQRTALQTTATQWGDELLESGNVEPVSEDGLAEVPARSQDEARWVRNGEPADSYERVLDEELRQYDK